MKALAIDSSGQSLCVSARNADSTVSCIYDIGMRQSEMIVEAIDHVLNKTGIKKSGLDFAALCAGPGSFTSLRLSFSALKAINLAWGTPVYAVPTLEAIAHPYIALHGVVIPVLDARKGRFYASLYKNSTEALPVGDYTIEEILQAVSSDASAAVFAVGGGALLFKEKAAACGNFEILPLPNVPITFSLFDIAAEYIKKGTSPMKDFDGPLYFRPCDAETHLGRKETAKSAL